MKMDRLEALHTFSEVIRCGSLVHASSRLSVSTATVTKRIQWLERELGMRLLQRTSRRIAITEAGRRALAGARDMLERYETMADEVRDSERLPKGSIRLGTPSSFGASHLMRLVTEFSEAYPDISLTIVLDDGRVDLVGTEFDLSIRIAPANTDASFIAEHLVRVPQVMVASPLYFEKRQRPKTLAELPNHNCLVNTLKSPGGVWRFVGSPPIEVKVGGAIRSGMGDALKNAALLGFGISIHPYYMVHNELQSGELELVIPTNTPEAVDIHVVYSARRTVPQRVRHFLEFLRRWARNPPDWATAGANRRSGAKQFTSQA